MDAPPTPDPTVVSLCTGYGGLEMGLALAGVSSRLVFVADPDPAASKVIAERYRNVPNFGDITAIDWHHTAQMCEQITILLAGYPCQGESLAGKRQGDQDERWIWPDVASAIRHLRPRHVFLENVPGHRSMGLGRVLADLAALGYVGSWRSVLASEVGAAHRRERLFIYAYPADAEHGDPGTDQLDRIAPATARRGADALLPTPGARLGNSTSITPATAARRLGEGKQNLDDWAALLPTPTATDGGRGGRSAAVTHTTLPDAVTRLDTVDVLLPTPRASANENRSTRRTPSQAAGRHGLYLSSEMCELDLLLPSAAQPGRWGAYAAAIARWEAVTGRPAPEPTEPGKTTAVRLAPPFVEWLMGLPPGWVTGVEGLSRNDMLRLCGNGVMPPQFAYAVGELYQDRVRRRR